MNTDTHVSFQIRDLIFSRFIPRSSCCLVPKLCSNLLRLHGLQPARLLSPWDSPGKNIGVGCRFPLQGIFLTQGSNLHLLHCSGFFTSKSPGKPVERDCRIMRKLYFQFLKEPPCSSIVAAPIHIPTDSVQRIPFLHTLSVCVCQFSSCVQLFMTPWTIYSSPGSSGHGILQARILE